MKVAFDVRVELEVLIKEALTLKYPEPLWAVQEYLAPYGVDI